MMMDRVCRLYPLLLSFPPQKKLLVQIETTTAFDLIFYSI